MSESIPSSISPESAEVELGIPLGRFLLAYLLTAASLVGFGYFGGETGFEMLVVAMGWPHVLLGFLFYCRKIKPENSPHRRYFWLLLLGTFSIWVTHAWLTVTTLIYLYFVFHAFRDEIFIFRQRSSGFRRGSPVFDRAGLAFLLAVMLLSGVDQLSWVGWRPVLRSVEVPLAEVAGGDALVANFDPIEDSSGRDYYFELDVPESQEPLSFWTYFANHEDATGRMFVDRRDFEFVTRVPFAKDLLFETQYSGIDGAAPVPVEYVSSGLFPMTGGHAAGQTFRAQGDGLKTILVPLRWEGPVTSDLAMVLTLQPAFAIQYPFLEPAGFLVVMLLASLVVFWWSRASASGRGREVTFFLLLIALLFGARLGLEASRHYLLIAPLFFSFLVVFHYFSWYVFSMEKITASPRPGAAVSREEGGLDWILRRISSRSGFLKTVLVLNLISLAGVVAYQSSLPLSGLRYAFDMEYFLYFLVFHVTMSFAPKTLPPNAIKGPNPA